MFKKIGIEIAAKIPFVFLFGAVTGCIEESKKPFALVGRTWGQFASPEDAVKGLFEAARAGNQDHVDMLWEDPWDMLNRQRTSAMKAAFQFDCLARKKLGNASNRLCWGMTDVGIPRSKSFVVFGLNCKLSNACTLEKLTREPGEAVVLLASYKEGPDAAALKSLKFTAVKKGSTWKLTPVDCGIGEGEVTKPEATAANYMMIAAGWKELTSQLHAGKLKSWDDVAAAALKFAEYHQIWKPRIGRAGNDPARTGGI